MIEDKRNIFGVEPRGEGFFHLVSEDQPSFKDFQQKVIADICKETEIPKEIIEMEYQKGKQCQNY